MINLKPTKLQKITSEYKCKVQGDPKHQRKRQARTEERDTNKNVWDNLQYIVLCTLIKNHLL